MVARWFRHPILHFFALGAAMFVVQTWLRSGVSTPAPQRAPIVVSAERIAALRSDFMQRFGREPSEPQLSALLAQTIEEELLYREALLLALDYDDASVQRRLLEKMRALRDRPGDRPDELIRQAQALGLDDDVVIRRLLVEKMRLVLAHDPPLPAPTDAELRDYVARHRERFEQPAERTFIQVFVSERVHGNKLARAARTRLSKLRSRPLSEAARHSDPFPLEHDLRAQAYPRVLARFGRAFADRVFALEPGLWSEPVPSPFGSHLVWVVAKNEAHLPALSAIREQVTQAVLAERATTQLTAAMARLRGLYAIRVEGRDDLSTRSGGLAALP